MTTDDVRTLRSEDARDGVRLLTLDRPGARNAMSTQLRRELRRALREAETDDGIRAVVLTGEGSAFSAGIDLVEGLRTADALHEAQTPATVARSMQTPVVVAANGACMTGALELALSCSFIIASDRATFGDTHAAVGLVDGWGGSALLPRAVGVRMARRMMTTGETIDADTALRCGLVTEVVPHDDLLPRALDVAAAIAAAEPKAVRATMALLAAGDGATTAHALSLEADVSRTWRIDADDLGQRFRRLLDS
ncbi:MAG: crt 4 [Aeromicrobium sp.]|nr:crt 4 [Aeromicrobium sp.]